MVLCQEISSVSQCNLCHTHHRRNRIFWQKSKIQSKKIQIKIKNPKIQKVSSVAQCNLCHIYRSRNRKEFLQKFISKRFCKNLFLAEFFELFSVWLWNPWDHHTEAITSTIFDSTIATSLNTFITTTTTIIAITNQMFETAVLSSFIYYYHPLFTIIYHPFISLITY